MILLIRSNDRTLYVPNIKRIQAQPGKPLQITTKAYESYYLKEETMKHGNA